MLEEKGLDTKLWIILFLLVLALPACAPDPNGQFIQGSWDTGVDVDTTEVNTTNTYIEWRFTNGTFYLHQEIGLGAPLNSQGSYQILESEGDLIVLELFNIQGDVFTYNNTSTDLRIRVDRDQDAIWINNTRFDRVGY